MLPAAAAIAALAAGVAARRAYARRTQPQSPRKLEMTYRDEISRERRIAAAKGCTYQQPNDDFDPVSLASFTDILQSYPEELGGERDSIIRVPCKGGARCYAKSTVLMLLQGHAWAPAGTFRHPVSGEAVEGKALQRLKAEVGYPSGWRSLFTEEAVQEADDFIRNAPKWAAVRFGRRCVTDYLRFVVWKSNQNSGLAIEPEYIRAREIAFRAMRESSGATLSTTVLREILHFLRYGKFRTGRGTTLRGTDEEIEIAVRAGATAALLYLQQSPICRANRSERWLSSPLWYQFREIFIDGLKGIG